MNPATEETKVMHFGELRSSPVALASKVWFSFR